MEKENTLYDDDLKGYGVIRWIGLKFQKIVVGASTDKPRTRFAFSSAVERPTIDLGGGITASMSSFVPGAPREVASKSIVYVWIQSDLSPQEIEAFKEEPERYLDRQYPENAPLTEEQFKKLQLDTETMDTQVHTYAQV